MNNLAFQIYGTKKATPFQSVWDTTNVALGVETANRTASSLPSDWALAPGGTNLLTGGYTHNGSGSSVLPFSFGSAAFQNYQIICTLSAGSIGSVVINLGNVSSASLSDSSTTIILTPTAGSGTLSITPVNFVGTVSLSIKTISSAANQIQLPITSIPVGKSIWIDWGDNSYSTMNSTNIIANRTHTYSTPGEYAVRILGDNFNFTFTDSGTNDRLKIKSISSWGKLKFSSYSFFGCSNVIMSGVTDIPDLTGLNNFQYLFGGCGNITTIGRINEWNTSSVTSMTNTFDGCGKFNSDISNWDVSNITNFSQMFINATSFNNGFAFGIANQLPWNTSACTNMASMFQNCTAFNSNLGTGTTPWNVSKVTSFAGMFYVASNFRNGDEVTQSKINDWAINTVSNVNMASMFQSASNFNRDVSNWNMTKVIDTSSMFYQARDFNQPLANWERSTLGNISTLANVTNMQSMFQGIFLFNQPIGNWNVSGVTTMLQMFNFTIAFNQDISSWNVGKVATFTGMFSGATAFNNGGNSDTNPITLRTGINGWNIGTNASSVVTNQMFQNTNFNRYIGDWDVSKVTAMGNMFLSNGSFNQDLSKWNVGSVTSMEAMFYNADAFNNGSNTNTNPVTGLIGIDGWNINTTAASVTMVNMFAANNAFNQPIGSWNVSKVTNMNSMFNDARVFNNGLPSGTTGTMIWDTSAVTDMYLMFARAIAFNQNIGSWNVSSVTSFGEMFQSAFLGGSKFNNGGSSDINNWVIKNTGTVSMGGMFWGAVSFNQPIGSWDVSKVTTMGSMFSGATVFNQNIGSWNVSNVTNFSKFMDSKTPANFSSTNLDAIYNGWIVNGVQPNISSPLATNISFGSAMYTANSSIKRGELEAAPNNWRITDGGITTIIT